ncbi:MAG: iron ABC transporter permease [Lachnospiraceae bacterium]|nr:iron ABC transporter permease [Lachnospiraceae bacterium]
MKENKNINSKNSLKISIVVIILLLVIPILVAVLSLGMGRMSVPYEDIIKYFMGKPISPQYKIILSNVRIPRIIGASLVGASLPLAGLIFQSYFSNPLATPDTLGVASGSCFGAALAIFLGLQVIGVEIVSFLFGIFTIVLTGITGLKRNESKYTIILAGIIVGSLFQSLIALVKFVADTDTQLPSITYFLMGSFQSVGKETLIIGGPIIIVCIVIIFLLRWRINLLTVDDEVVRTMGVNITSLRAIVIVAATIITAISISMAGQVGWVGLIVPHFCRMLVGENHTKLVPYTISIGISFMLIIDLVARSLFAAEIPISVLTSLIGAPFFIYMIRQRKGIML